MTEGKYPKPKVADSVFIVVSAGSAGTDSEFYADVTKVGSKYFYCQELYEIQVRISDWSIVKPATSLIRVFPTKEIREEISRNDAARFERGNAVNKAIQASKIEATMTEQQLCDKLSAKLKYYGLEDYEATMAASKIAEDYADARTSAKDAEIEEMGVKVDSIESDLRELRDNLEKFNKDARIAMAVELAGMVLTADLPEEFEDLRCLADGLLHRIDPEYEIDLQAKLEAGEARQHIWALMDQLKAKDAKIAALKAEVARLREGIALAQGKLGMIVFSATFADVKEIYTNLGVLLADYPADGDGVGENLQPPNAEQMAEIEFWLGPVDSEEGRGIGG